MERKITIEESGSYREDYQMRMLLENRIPGLLPVKGRGVDDRRCYDYDVSGKISMKAMFERGKIESRDLKEFLVQLQEVLGEVKRYLLNIHCVLLDTEYIYYEDGRYFFCYYPPEAKDFWVQFHVLTEYFVKQADYDDKDCVQMVFLLHKETMKQNYSLEKIVDGCVGITQKDEGKEEEEEEKTLYDTRQHDWIHEQKEGSRIMEETDRMWKPVQRFLRRHKKSKWGDWDGLDLEA